MLYHLWEIRKVVADVKKLSLVCIICSFTYITCSCSSSSKDVVWNPPPWYIPYIHADEMWKIFNKLERDSVTVAIIDSGIDITHNDLTNAIWLNDKETPNDLIDNDNNGYIDDINGWNFVDNSNEIYNTELEQEDTHGTMCAGIVLETCNKICDKRSTCREKLKIMTIKVLKSRDDENIGSIDNLVKAIKYAQDNGAKVCNLSLNTDKDLIELRSIIKQSSMLFVVSAGNNSPIGLNIDKAKTYPACYNYDNVITVSNADINGDLEAHSNYGIQTIDIAAPGTNIFSTSIKSKYDFATGTSMATPVVTGVAAEIYMCFPNIQASDVKRAICNSAFTSDRLKDYIGNEKGIVNGKNALLYCDNLFNK